MTKSICNCVVLCAMTLGILSPALAQQSVGTITGKVTDAMGAAIPNAAIAITEKATNTVRNDVTNSAGLYNAPSLASGEYEVRVSLPGFQTTVRDATVEAGKTTVADFPLTTGAGTEVVRVEAVSPQVNYTGQNVVTGNVNRETTEATPLNGRSNLQTASLEPGVTVGAGGGTINNGLVSVSVPGGSLGSMRHMLDGGINNNHSEVGGLMMNVSQEIVLATQVSSLSFDPSNGIGGGGAVNTVTRGGTNDFHGDGYLFYRDHNFASFPGLKRSAVDPNPFFQRKDPGFYLGGPILKNKLFFFGSYERLIQTTVVNFDTDLPSTQAMNVIQPSPLHYNWVSFRFDYHLSPKNTMFVRYTHENNYSVGGSTNQTGWAPTYNWADQSMFAWTSIVSPTMVNDFRAYYAYWNNRFITFGLAPGVGPGGPGTGNNYGTAGLSCISAVACIGNGDPTVTSMVGSSVVAGLGAYSNGPQMHQERSAELKDNIIWQKGRHQIRFGEDFEHVNMVYRPWDNCEPACVAVYSVEQTLALGKAFPAGSFANLPTSINSTAALNSLPVSMAAAAAAASAGVSIGNGTWPGTYEPNVGGVNLRIQPFIGDTWKVSNSLTVNYGLEYNLETGLFPSNMPVPSYLNPILQGKTNGLPYGTGKGVPANTKDFAPLVGFAYAIGKGRKTVIRGGGGMYWDTIATWWQMGAEASQGPAGDGHALFSASNFVNIFPNMYYNSSKGVVPLPIGAPLPANALSTITLGDFIQIIDQQGPTIESAISAANGGTVTSGPYKYSGVAVAKNGTMLFPATFALPHSFQTDIGIQRELSGSMVVSADWVRKQGEHLSLNAIDGNRYGLISDGGSPVIPVCKTTPDFNPTDECSNGSITIWDNQGRGVYDGLLVKLQKRLSHNYSFLVSYALQKQETLNATDLNNFFLTYGPGLAKQNLNISGTGNLPWGFRLTLNSSITTAAPANPSISGIDLTDSGVASTALSLAVPDLPYGCINYSCGKTQLAAAVALFDSTVAGTKSFNGVTVPTLTLPSQYQLGSHTVNQDVRLTKEFVYKEKYHLQVFGEVFNVLNIGNEGYSTTLNTSTFGTVTSRVGGTSTFASGGPRGEQFGARITF